MKQAENNEIDSLLRGLARRGVAGASAERSATLGRKSSAESSMHLDADELSAYAENALPVATRARYTTHLADCDDCRKVVAQLTIAAGLPASERAVSGATEASTWKEKLAALFSPPVLRYLLPALVLVAVVAVSFVALRPRREASFVAQNQPGESSPVAVAQNEPEESAPASSQRETKSAGNEASRANQTQSKSAATSSGKAAGTSTAAAASPTPAPAKDKDAARNETAAAAQPSYAREPPPSPKPSDEKARADQPAKVAAEDQESRDANARAKEAEKRNASGVAGGIVTQSAARKARAESSGAKPSSTGTAGGRADDEAETRVVAGRRFRRQSSAWVDTAYDASQSTTDVARGSEQYRALIADEPAMRTIAEQLSGQVIVVWKGRAYRIR